MEDVPIVRKSGFVLILLLLALVCGDVWGAFNFFVQPSVFEFRVQAGKSQTAHIRIINKEKTDTKFKVYLKDFIRGKDGSEREVDPGECERGCAKWVRMSPTKFVLKPNEAKTVRLTIDVPETARGAYFCKVYVEEDAKQKKPKEIKGKTTFTLLVGFRQEIRIHEYVPGTAIKKGKITDMTITDATEKTPFNVTVNFENTGNDILRCSGRVEIRDEDGENVTNLLLEKTGSFSVYTGNTRFLKAVASDKLPPGNYIALAIIDYGGEDLVAGEMEFEVK